ncbi:hypothetical protein DJ533_10730 [Acinetobacter defluvii]|uniref:Uncharacterized protein n=1 Tax=Acinetobacter defluvii TaxID=1871111 RepID=A0A2S2FDF6_9GAMM|nr:hypothetical protein [Acinetobacter defluvii]AWL29006.2 hypothetical protein DJ533_10730 [Acinetobacter defluvii]
MKLRLCTNIVLKTSINIGENIKPEIIEALALELTKSKLANKETTASDWVQAYKESHAEIEEVCDEGRVHHQPLAGGSRVFNDLP